MDGGEARERAWRRLYDEAEGERMCRSRGEEARPKDVSEHKAKIKMLCMLHMKPEKWDAAFVEAMLRDHGVVPELATARISLPGFVTCTFLHPTGRKEVVTSVPETCVRHVKAYASKLARSKRGKKRASSQHSM